MRLETRFSGVGDNPVTLAEAKARLRVATANTTEDAMVTTMIDSATEWCERYLMRSLRTKTVEALFTDMNGELLLDLPYAPVNTISEVLAVYGDGTSTEIIAGSYSEIGLNERQLQVPYLFTTRGLKGYKVTYTTLAQCPSAVKDVILKMVAEMWAVRSVTVDSSGSQGGLQEPQMLSMYKLLDPYRLKTWF